MKRKKIQRRFSAWARLCSVEPADIRMNGFSVAFGGNADIGAQNPTCYMCCLAAEPIRQNDP